MCRCCEKEYPRKDMNQIYENTFICDSCNDIKDNYESIEIEKISENLFVGFWLEDQQIIRSILGKTLMSKEEFHNISESLYNLGIEVEIIEREE